MASPFPGMDPYLEQPTLWSSFHTRLLVAIADALEPQLGSEYYVEVETRTYQSEGDEESLAIGIPDAIVFSQTAVSSGRSNPAIQEDRGVLEASTATQVHPELVMVPLPKLVSDRYLEVRDTRTNKVVTAIELLSPKNKRAGEGRTAYEKKRRAVLTSATHLVELDLLRGGKPMAILGMRSPATYRILISRSDRRPNADLYGVALQQPLPSVPIPLKPGDSEPILPLQTVLQGVCDRARYASRIDYRQPVPPPQLAAAEQRWVDELLASLRGE